MVKTADGGIYAGLALIPTTYDDIKLQNKCHVVATLHIAVTN